MLFKPVQIPGAHLGVEVLFLTGKAEYLEIILTSVAMMKISQFRYSCPLGPRELKRHIVCKRVNQ